MMDHHPGYDWQTIVLSAVSLAWGAKWGHWVLPLMPTPDRFLEWSVALLVALSVIVLNTLKIQQLIADRKERKRNNDRT